MNRILSFINKNISTIGVTFILLCAMALVAVTLAKLVLKEQMHNKMCIEACGPEFVYVESRERGYNTLECMCYPPPRVPVVKTITETVP